MSPTIKEAALRAGVQKNGNGTTRKALIAALVTLGVGFLGFTITKIYVIDPSCYATQVQLRKVESDMNEKIVRQGDDVKYIRDRIDRFLERVTP